MFDLLKDRIILVVGGTSGIGLSVASACLQCGASVTIIGPTANDIEMAKSKLSELSATARSLFIEGDASTSEVAALAVESTIEQYGTLDGLIHVAGGSGRGAGDGPLHEFSDEGWTWTINANLDSTAWSNRAVTKYWMLHQRGGSVVNIGSVLATHPAADHFATHAYAAAKSGIIGLTRSAASHYAKHNIRFNVVAPGLIQTPMSARALGDKAIIQYVRSKQPLDGGRVGMPNDLDGIITFLLSDQARWMTGQVIDVDGGWTVSEGSVQ